MKAINENEFAKRVTLRGRGKIGSGIGEVKEILKNGLDDLAAWSKKYGMSAVVALVEKHKK